MKTIILTHKELSNIENTVKGMGLTSCYSEYEQTRLLRTALIQEKTNNPELVVTHERDLTITRLIRKPKGFTNEELQRYLGYGVESLPYHMVENGLVYKQSENGGLSMSRGARQFRRGSLLTEIFAPTDYTVVVE
jgi:hypothetical protein